MYQSYPNPFNPSTKIKYSIPKESEVMIKVFDILGNEVMTLVSEKQQAGTYDVEFSTSGGGSDFVSGIYIYQIKAGEFTQTRKMLLIK
ncbi:MAG: T9SS type A sorting domain-containing protein [Candidatus Kariarchaeaceae archaeon]